jgi:hypothetical protein
MDFLHTRFKAFSRGKGESSLAAAAYRAGVDLVGANGAQHRYSARRGVISTHMLAPPGAPAWCLDIDTFWSKSEAHETRANARVAREVEVALPHALNPAQRQALAIALGEMLVARYRCVVLVAIHAPSQRGDQRNFHTHLLMSARQVGPAGLGDRAASVLDARQGRGQVECKLLREQISVIMNAHLLAAGIEQQVDPRSFKEQAKAAAAEGDLRRAVELSRKPTRHIGKAATALARKAEAQMERTGGWQGILKNSQASTVVPLRPAPTSASELAVRLKDAPVVPLPRAPARIWQGRDLVSWQPSPYAIHLQRVGKIARSQGKGAEVLNIEAELIEAWLEAQREVAREALAMVSAIFPEAVQPPFQAAVDAVLLNRVPLYGTKPFFFEDSEWLCRTVIEHARARRRPRDREAVLALARRRVFDIECTGVSTADPELLAARRAAWNARSALTETARRQLDQAILQTGEVMDETRIAFEDEYFVSTITSAFAPQQPAANDARPRGDVDTSRQSGSNTRELRMRLTGAMGRRG